MGLLLQVKRLSIATCSTEASLTEARSKVEALARQLKDIRHKLDASEGLEQDLKRLGREAQEMNEDFNNKLGHKQVLRRPTITSV